ncbi:MAG: TIGR00341 family protein [Gammaproteobacteria bacterium]|jgi:uncharacterized hydrophobic protein (TIGR00341 family)
MRVIEIIADDSNLDTLTGIAEQHEVADFWYGDLLEDGRRVMRMLVDDASRQSVIDALQSLLGGSDSARILIMPVDAVLPRKEDAADADKAKTGSGQTREELYNDIERGARLDSTFLLLVFLSTIVASIGLIENNIAVIVGAMVIAPLLGPNIALAFSTSLGDRELMWQALKTNLAGLSLTLVMTIVIGMIWPGHLNSFEILVRTDVKPDGIVLALASGAAAVLSLATGLSSALVGVMVAVALLPPTATLGMMLGSGQFSLAQGASLLLAVNVVSINLAAKLMFLLKGVKPRTWLEKRKARQSFTLYILIWIVTLVILLTAILARQQLVT